MVEDHALVLAVTQGERAVGFQAVVHLMGRQPSRVASRKELRAAREAVWPPVHPVGASAAGVELPLLPLRVPPARPSHLDLTGVLPLLEDRLGRDAVGIAGVNDRESASARPGIVDPCPAARRGPAAIECVGVLGFFSPSLPAVVDLDLVVDPKPHTAIDPEESAGDGKLVLDHLDLGGRDLRRWRRYRALVIMGAGDVDHVRHQEHLHRQVNDRLATAGRQSRDRKLAPPAV